MAYTIQILKGGDEKQLAVFYALQARLDSSRFKAVLKLSQAGKFPAVIIKLVRLRVAKPYCGNHPGECVINPFIGKQKKKIMTLLECDDWVAFHKLVNTVLNKGKTHANVWSNPHDVSGKMWIRKDLSPRVRFDWKETYTVSGFPIRHWNTGTPDQFAT